VFKRLVRQARLELEAVYASDAPDAVKRERKRAVLIAMREAYEAAKQGDAGLAAYDRWFAGFDGGGPNNAALAAVALYDEEVPAFRALLEQVNGEYRGAREGAPSRLCP
jgi:predicted aminopeptidase